MALNMPPPQSVIWEAMPREVLDRAIKAPGRTCFTIGAARKHMKPILDMSPSDPIITLVLTREGEICLYQFSSVDQQNPFGKRRKYQAMRIWNYGVVSPRRHQKATSRTVAEICRKALSEDEPKGD